MKSFKSPLSEKEGLGEGEGGGGVNVTIRGETFLTTITYFDSSTDQKVSFIAPVYELGACWDQ